MELFLSNEDVQQLLTMHQYIDSIETAYRELGLGRAWNNPRIHTYGQAKSGGTHFLKVFTGTVAELGYSALRIDSTMEHNESGAETSKQIGSRHLGWLMLFSVESGDLEAIIEDRHLQRMRVGAMTGVAAKYLARTDSRTIGLLGSGAQSGPQLEAVAAVMNIKQVKVFSPTAANRERFAAIMTEALGLDVLPVSSSREAVSRSDIVIVATNSNEPVFDGRWLEDGTFVSSIVNSDKHLPRRDLDDETLRRASSIVVSTRDQIKHDEPTWLTEGLARGAVSWEKIWEIGELVCGKSPRRNSDKEITVLKNNGLSVQFVGVGAAIIAEARKRRLGKELPSYMFEKSYRT
jgi:alanine dehydrogenase